MSSTQSERPLGERSSAISNLIVGLVSEYTGRGPTKARTYITDDVITVILQDTLTKGERSLVKDGKGDLVLSIRLSFQGAMRTELIDGVEQIMGRKVRAFMSANHLEPDIAAETFVLDRLTPQDGLV
ncbi:MAG: Na-translocating system protein MpsC family protein [Solirubrobacteraceae bacterium]